MTPTGRDSVGRSWFLRSAPVEGANGAASYLVVDRVVDHRLNLGVAVLAYFLGTPTEWLFPLFALGVLTGVAEWLTAWKA
jgi:hypothetical protein